MTNHNSKLTPEALQQFTGTQSYYRHGLNRNVLYTDGVKFIAEEGGAYWLIDAIASWINSHVFQRAAAEDCRIESLHFWKLVVHENGSARLDAITDSPDTAFIVQSIPLTDFPLKSIDIWAAFDGQHWVLYLPSEH